MGASHDSAFSAPSRARARGGRVRRPRRSSRRVRDLPVSPHPAMVPSEDAPVITGDAEIVEFYERDDRAFVRTDA